MVTLHLLEYLKGKGFGPNLFFEELPLGKTGIGIYSVGGERPYGGRSRSQLFDLESRGGSNLSGMDALEKIAEHFAEEFFLGDLPTIEEVSLRKYTNCRVVDMSNIQNLGQDAEGRVIFKLTGRLIYKKEG
ncbi:hypothetical protein MPC38_06765 [Prescottella equi]|uniref:hypothetical protein n=1 Tax=Rhodococcus hoagii TaxID=43767 RepID=UPI001F5BB275|nr:hypothetical protein [Prescottella equi]UNQ40947.1 hypothetical protein MPC38_06765 [Prescottella equi]